MAETTIIDGRHAYRPQAIGRVFGWFFLATFLTSIPAYFIGYAKMLETPSLITGNGADPSTGIATGATLEVFLIIANVATAVVAYPVLKRESEMGAIGYVSARLVEAMFIAIGIVSALAFLLMRQEATAASTPVLGEAFVAILPPSVPGRAWLLRGSRERRGPGLPDVPIRAGAARHDVAGSHRRSARHDHRHLGHVQRDRARRRGASHRDVARGPLGAVAQHLLHREGVQAFFPHPPLETVTLPDH